MPGLSSIHQFDFIRYYDYVNRFLAFTSNVYMFLRIENKTRGPADLLLDMGQMRTESSKPNIALLQESKILYDLIFSVQVLPPQQVLAQFEGFIRAYMSPLRPPEGRFIHQNFM